MLDPLNTVMNDYGSLLQIRDKLTTLSNSSPVMAGILIFVMSFIGLNILATQTMELPKKMLGEWRHSPLAWIGLAAATLVAGVAAYGIVVDLRRASSPVPVLLVDTDTVVGRPLLLSWKYDAQDEGFVQFEVQGSATRDFREIYKTLYRSGRATLVGPVNKKLYWRVRAVNERKLALGNWSQPVRITQYDDALTRIQDTRSVSVYVSNALNQGFFEFEDNDGNIKGYDLAVIQYIVERLAERLKIGGPVAFNPVAVDWQTLLDAPKNGHADIIISAITALSAREDDYGIKFSKPYYCTTQSILFRTRILNTPIASAIENKRVGVVSKTTSDDMIRKFPGTFSVRSYDDGVQMIADVAKGEVDFAMIDTPLARGAELQYGSGQLSYRELASAQDFPKAIAPERHQEKYAVAVRSGEPRLIDAINEIIEEMRAEKLQQFLQDATADFYQTRKDQSAPVDARADPSVCSSQLAGK
jgi:ABC-type amino acid transport substrate-binding protein